MILHLRFPTHISPQTREVLQQILYNVSRHATGFTGIDRKAIDDFLPVLMKNRDVLTGSDESLVNPACGEENEEDVVERYFCCTLLPSFWAGLADFTQLKW